MLAEEEIDFPLSSGSNICRRFYSCSKKRIYELPVPKCQGRFCCGSYAGWIATVGKDSRMHLVNIFTGGGVELPSLYAFGTSFSQCCNRSPERKRSLFVTKVCLSSSPSAGRDCLVVAFYGIGCKLGYAKVGDDQWTTVSCNWCPYLDASFYKGQFYVVNWKGDVVVLDVSRRQVHFISTKPKQLMTDYTHRKIYLVESSGDLLYVVRVFRYSPKPTYNTKSFVVYKLSVSNGELQQVSSLGGRSLFLGLNNSISVEASKLVGCQKDSIYFTDDLSEFKTCCAPGSGRDTGIYSMVDGCITPHYDGVSLSRVSPPLWVPIHHLFSPSI
ncbi:uncharacterized protein LOC135673961 [Musa acuminata AAA Group]|uniref:uncharacterized protein LOC135638182 n=1 Tax=Musa acuminata AAA Group TaxID=214697 RepID=UPI0031D99E02